MSLSSPAPRATIGRTDEGVDWSNVRQTDAPGAGIITQIFTGLRGFGTTIIERLTSGRYTYTALESSGDTPTVRPGERVRAGQLTSSGGSGGGIEVGYWNPRTGAAIAAPGYTEGQPTAAGQQFRSALSGRGGSGTGGSGNLSQLWIDAGGSPKLANTMAAIALAESGGNQHAVGGPHSNGTYDYGLWQINSANGYDKNRLLNDPLYNAQAAVAIEKSQGLTAWTTYSTGAYKAFLGMHGKTYGFSRTRPGGASDSGAGVTSLFTDYLNLRDAPRTAPPKSASIQWWLQEFQARANKVFSG